MGACARVCFRHGSFSANLISIFCWKVQEELTILSGQVPPPPPPQNTSSRTCRLRWAGHWRRGTEGNRLPSGQSANSGWVAVTSGTGVVHPPEAPPRPQPSPQGLVLPFHSLRKVCRSRRDLPWVLGWAGALMRRNSSTAPSASGH